MAKPSMIELLQKDLLDLSLFLGNNLDWVQGAGGNTSVKKDGILLVKASGFWLSESSEKMFVPLDREMVLKKIDEEAEDLSTTQLFNNSYKALKPSIETTMHALMPHRFVAHVHSANVISISVLNNARKILNEKLKNLRWVMVPYVRPGIPLTKKLNSLDISNIDIIILGNHGLVIGGDSIVKVKELLLEVEKRLYRPLREKHKMADLHKIELLIKDSKFKLPKYDFSHTLAKDDLAMKILKNNALYPDHVIFLGPVKIPIISYDDFKQKLQSGLKDYQNQVILIKDFGLIVSNDISQNAEEMLYSLANVILRLNPRDKINYLTTNDEAELIGWDAEKYRKLIQK